MSSLEPPTVSAFKWPPIFSLPRTVTDESWNTPYVEFAEFDSDSDDSDSDSNGSDSDSDDCGNGSGGLDLNVRLVSRFMRRRPRGRKGPEQCHLNQESVVSGFCERAYKYASNEPACVPPFIAITDVRSNVGVGPDGHGVGVPRTQIGGRTPAQLTEELGFWKAPNIPSGEKASTDLSEGPFIRADRVLVYLSNMDASGIQVLAKMAPIRQREALIKFFYTHICPSPCVNVSLKTNGIPGYTMHLSIPFIALRYHKSLREDVRKRPSGDSLRNSWIAECLTAQSYGNKASPKKACIYEAQASVSLTGTENFVYTVYGTIDTYYESKSEHSVKVYHRSWKENGCMWDPFLGWTCILDRPVWESRLYFLMIWKAQLANAVLEWDKLTDEMKGAADKRCLGLPETGTGVKDFNTWNEEMLRRLSHFSTLLSETIQDWDEFNKTDIGHFTHDGNEERISHLGEITKSYSKLRKRLTSLKALQLRLSDTNRQEIQSFFGFQTYNAAANALGVTLILLLFTPFTQVTGMFNMQTGVLPFTANPRNFGISLLICVLVYLTVCGLYFRWEFWSRIICAGFKSANSRGKTTKSTTETETTAETTTTAEITTSADITTPTTQHPPPSLPHLEESIEETGDLGLGKPSKQGIMARILPSKSPVGDDDLESARVS